MQFLPPLLTDPCRRDDQCAERVDVGRELSQDNAGLDGLAETDFVSDQHPQPSVPQHRHRRLDLEGQKLNSRGRGGGETAKWFGRAEHAAHLPQPFLPADDRDPELGPRRYQSIERNQQSPNRADVAAATTRQPNGPAVHVPRHIGNDPLVAPAGDSCARCDGRVWEHERKQATRMPRSGRTRLKGRKLLYSVDLGAGRSNLRLAPSARGIARSPSLLSARYAVPAYGRTTARDAAAPHDGTTARRLDPFKGRLCSSCRGDVVTAEGGPLSS